MLLLTVSLMHSVDLRAGLGFILARRRNSALTRCLPSTFATQSSLFGFGTSPLSCSSSEEISSEITCCLTRPPLTPLTLFSEHEARGAFGDLGPPGFAGGETPADEASIEVFDFFFGSCSPRLAELATRLPCTTFSSSLSFFCEL